MLQEIGATLRYPKVRKRIASSDEELDRYVQALRFMADVVDPAGATVSVHQPNSPRAIFPELC